MISRNHICVSSPYRDRRQPSAIGLVFLLVAGALAGCSMGDGIGPYIVDPGRFSAYRCKDLVDRLKTITTQEKEFRELMDKASEGGGGTVIGNLAYRPDYELVVGEERVLRRRAGEKKCELPPPASAASATGPNFQSDQIIH